VRETKSGAHLNLEREGIVRLLVCGPSGKGGDPLEENGKGGPFLALNSFNCFPLGRRNRMFRTEGGVSLEIQVFAQLCMTFNSPHCCARQGKERGEMKRRRGMYWWGRNLCLYQEGRSSHKN